MVSRASSRTQILAEEPFKDKVALLLGGARLGGGPLAVSLAKHGADVAIVYRQADTKRARKIKRMVEAEGRSCLIVPAKSRGDAFSKEAIRQTIDRMGGRLDIFIDYTTLSQDVEPTNRGDSADDERDQTGPGPSKYVDIVSAALDQIVRMAQAFNQDNQDVEPMRRVRRRYRTMKVARELINKPVISVNEGQEVGKVQDFYLDQNATHLVAIHLGSEGLFGRKETLIRWPDVVTLGRDAILVKDANCVTDSAEVEELESYVRRDDISDRPVNTPGGTKIGHIGDVVLDDEAKIAGFSLSQVYVSGPIAANRALSRSAVVDIGNEAGVMTANLSQAEKANLQVVYEGILASPTVTTAESEPEETTSAT